MVSPGDTARASDYNSIRTSLYNLLGTTSTGYGASLLSSTATTGNVITHVEWDNLYDDILRCSWHQVGNISNIWITSMPRPAAGSRITSAGTNAIINSIQNFTNNRFNVFTATQITSTTDNAISTRTGSWGVASPDIEHTIEYNWATLAEAQYFFNQGGYFIPKLTANLQTVVASQDQIWYDLIDQFNAVVLDQNYRYDRTNYYAASNTYTFGISEYGGDRTITVTYSRNGAKLTANIALVTHVSEDISLDLSSISTTYYSTSLNGGVQAPVPIATPSRLLSQIGSFALLLVTPSPVPKFSFKSGSSQSRTITLVNTGTVSATVSSIVGYTNGSFPSLVTTVNPTGQIVAAGGTGIFSLTYSGDASDGEHTGYLLVNSNNVYGVIKIPTVFEVLFKATISPATNSATVTNNNLFSYQYSMSSIHGLITSITWSINSVSGFAINSNGLLSYDPRNQPNGVSTVTVTATVYSNTGLSDTVTATFTMTRNVVTRSVGSWVSAQALYNSVVGMSYDYIDGVPYLTIGAGFGLDGSADLNNGGRTNIAKAVRMLGSKVGTDTIGTPVYPYQNGSYGNFLNTYGVWESPNGDPQVASGGSYTWYSATYTFATESLLTETYVYEFSCDNAGSFWIDEVGIANQNDPTASLTGSISLAPGQHTIRWRCVNTGGPGAVGIRITNSAGTDLWSTLTPIATSPSGLKQWYWGDLYRIPLTTANTNLFSANYYIRNGSWGGYFGTAGATGSMFTVSIDSGNNLSIKLNPLRLYNGDTGFDVTLAGFSESFYYYSAYHARYSNLENPINSFQTHYFTGFYANGQPSTTIVAFPVAPIVNTGGGGGGGYGGSDRGYNSSAAAAADGGPASTYGCGKGYAFGGTPAPGTPGPE